MALYRIRKNIHINGVFILRAHLPDGISINLTCPLKYLPAGPMNSSRIVEHSRMFGRADGIN